MKPGVPSSKPQIDANSPFAFEDPSSGAILVITAEGRLSSFTAEAAEILELLPNAPESSKLTAITTLAAKARSTGMPVLHHEISPNVRADFFPLQTGDNAPQVAVVLRRGDGHNLQRLDRFATLGLLSASLAHEIKNGMVAIKTFVDLLSQKNTDAELTDVAGREIRRITEIAGEMLKLGTPHSTAVTPVPLHDVLDRSLRLIQQPLAEKLISTVRRYNAKNEIVQGNASRLQQVFMNLLFNALEAMDSHGILTVATATHSGLLEIRIQDTGIGITDEHLKHLFQPFFTTKKNGTGLGLAISRQIVQEHGGDISVLSQAGKGSTFSISLPQS